MSFKVFSVSSHSMILWGVISGENSKFTFILCAKTTTKLVFVFRTQHTELFVLKNVSFQVT